jgi:predicted  nucleic acid-binding Zn-ribbon protein
VVFSVDELTMDRETADEIKRHFNVFADGLLSEIRTVAEGLEATNEKIDHLESRMTEELSEIKAMIRLSFGELDRRISSLESDVASLRSRLERLEARSGN